jgi:tetratricopeptide (TPR) repeat protein
VMGPHPELYDLVGDPHEHNNVLSSERRGFAALRQEIEKHDRRIAPPAAVDEESRKAMEALGYVGSSGSALSGPLPDPREHLDELRDLRAGFQAMSAKKPAEGEALFRRVIAKNPAMVDAWEFLGRSLERQDRPDEAIAAFQEALRLSKGSPHIAMSAASLMLERGRLDDAEQHAKLALASNPSFVHGLLAQVAVQRKDLVGAEREARLATETQNTDRVGPAVTMAKVQQAQGKLEEALASSDRALEAWGKRTARDPELIRGTYVLRGSILADLGRAEEAEQAFRKEIELFPEDPPAYTHLALLYALTGRGAEVGPLLQQLVEGHPSARAYAEVGKTLRVMRLPMQAEQLLAQGRRAYPGNPLLRPGA